MQSQQRRDMALYTFDNFCAVQERRVLALLMDNGSHNLTEDEARAKRRRMRLGPALHHHERHMETRG